MPGTIFQVGMEMEAVFVRTGAPLIEHSRFFYTTEISHAAANPFNCWTPDFPSVSGFLVDTGATTSKLRVEDIQGLPISFQTKLGVVLPTQATFLSAMIPIKHIGGHTFSPPILSPFLVPLQPQHSTHRFIGVDLMLRFAQVNFECGNVEFFTSKVPNPSGNSLSSNRVELRNLTNGVESTVLDSQGFPTRFFVRLEYRGEMQNFLVDTGSDSTHVPPLPVAEPTFVVHTDGTEEEIRLYPLTVEILGSSFSTKIAQFRMHNDESYVLGSDILSQLDVRLIRDETTAQIHIWNRCKQ